jgi:hypothetical protein
LFFQLLLLQSQTLIIPLTCLPEWASWCVSEICTTILLQLLYAIPWHNPLPFSRERFPNLWWF